MNLLLETLRNLNSHTFTYGEYDPDLHKELVLVFSVEKLSEY